jgi:hypothetical protein
MCLLCPVLYIPFQLQSESRLQPRRLARCGCVVSEIVADTLELTAVARCPVCLGHLPRAGGDPAAQQHRPHEATVQALSDSDSLAHSLPSHLEVVCTATPGVRPPLRHTRCGVMRECRVRGDVGGASADAEAVPAHLYELEFAHRAPRCPEGLKMQGIQAEHGLVMQRRAWAADSQQRLVTELVAASLRGESSAADCVQGGPPVISCSFVFARHGNDAIELAKRQGTQKLSLLAVLRIMLGVVRIFVTLQQRVGLVGIGLRPEWVFVDDDCNVRLCSSAVISNFCSRLCTLSGGEQSGRNVFLAPELLANGPSGPMSDVYSVGQVILYLMFGSQFSSLRRDALLEGHGHDRKDRALSVELLRDMTEMDPRQRCSWASVGERLEQQLQHFCEATSRVGPSACN